MTGSPSPTVLVADDQVINQIILQELLERILGVGPEVASDGQAALEAWRARRPELVLMDVEMPLMSGHEATRAIRQEERELGLPRHTLIVGLTAHTVDTELQRCLDSGMDDVLPKPVGYRELEALVARLAPGQQADEKQHAGADTGADTRDVNQAM